MGTALEGGEGGELVAGGWGVGSKTPRRENGTRVQTISKMAAAIFQDGRRRSRSSLRKEG